MGQSMTWAQAAFCPCRSVDTGSARAGCPICGSRGVLWAAPVPSVAGLSGMKAQRQWERFGEFEGGDVVISVGSNTPLYAAGENDRIVFLQSSEAFDLVLDAAGTDKLQFTVIACDRCFWLTPNNGQPVAVVEGTPPVQDATGVLTWPGGIGQPPAGVQYSVRGRKLPEYFLFKDFMQDRSHFSGLALPRRCVLRKFDLFGR